MENSKEIPYQVQWAEYFYKLGYSVIPIFGILPNGLCSCGDSNCSASGKHPMKRWEKTGTFESQEAIRQFWVVNPYANYAILTNELVVIDIDAKSGGVESYQNYLSPLIKELRTFSVWSGSGNGSKHIFFKKAHLDFRNSTNILAGIDIRAAGGYVVGVGSLHKSGTRYALADLGCDSSQIYISEMPSALVSLFNEQKKKGKSLHGVANFGLSAISEGGRNNDLISYAGKLIKKGNSIEEISTLLLERNKSFSPPLNESEVLLVLKSASKYKNQNEIIWTEPMLNYSVKSHFFEDINDELIPKEFLKFVDDRHRSTGVPKAAIMVSLISLVSGILGAAYKVSPSNASDYKVTLNLWGMVIAPSGSRKTSLVTLFQEVIDEINSYFFEKRKESLNINRKEISNLKAQLKNTSKDEVEKVAELEFKIVSIKEKEKSDWCFTVDSATPEALAQLFKYNFRGLMLLNDELGSLFESISKAGYEDLRPLLNKSWNGGLPHRLNRIMRGMIEIQSTTLSVFGGIQPDAISNYFKTELKKGASGDGFLARFQLLVAYSVRDMIQASANIDVKTSSRQVNAVFRALHDLTKDFNISGVDVKTLVLSNEALAIFSNFDRELNERISGDKITNQAYLSHISKYSRLVLSLTGQFHIIDSIISHKNINRDIEAATIQFAIKWVDFLDKQAESLYYVLARDVSAEVLLLKIKKGHVKDRDTVRSIYKKEWSGLKKRDDILSAIEKISDSNWITVEAGPPKGGGPTTEIVRLNPKLIDWLESNKKNNGIGVTDKSDERGDS